MKANRGGRRASTSTASVSVSNVPTNAQNLTDADANQIRDDIGGSYDASTKAAVKMYISNTDFDGQGHSMSQAMNYALNNDVDIANSTPSSINAQLGTHFNVNDIASMQYTDAYMQAAARDIGRDVNLQRGAHAGVLTRELGIANYAKMSEAQLQKALIGQTFTNKAYMSTSYDVTKNPFLSSSSGVSGGREVVFNIKAGAKTQIIFGAKKQSEIVINKGTNFRVTGVRYSGVTATPRGGASRPQIILDVETY